MRAIRFDDHAPLPPDEVERTPADLVVDGRLRKAAPPQPAVEIALELRAVQRESEDPRKAPDARDAALAVNEIGEGSEGSSGPWRSPPTAGAGCTGRTASA